MKIQTEYVSNIDYQRTYEKVRSVFPTEQNSRGILTIYIHSAVVNISPKGRVQVTCSNADEKGNVLNLLQPYLVPSSGKLRLDPYKAHFHTDWPPPSSFEFSACSSKCYCTCDGQQPTVTVEEMKAEFNRRYEALMSKLAFENAVEAFGCKRVERGDFFLF